MAHWSRHRLPEDAPPVVFPSSQYNDIRPLTQRQAYRTTRARVSMILPAILFFGLIYMAVLLWMDVSSSSPLPQIDSPHQAPIDDLPWTGGEDKESSPRPAQAYLAAQ